MIELIIKSLWHRRVQNIALLLSVAVGICLVFSVVLVQCGVSDGLIKAKERLGADILVVPSGAAVEPGEILYGGSPQNIYMGKNIEQKIAVIPGVERVTAQFFTQTLTEECCDIGESVRLVGYDPKTDWIVQPWLENIDKPQLAEDEIIVGGKVPTFSAQKIFILEKIFHVAAIMEPSGTGLDKSILMNIQAARDLAQDSANLQEVFAAQGTPADLVSAVLVEIKPDANILDIRAQIEALGQVHAFSAAETKRHIYDQLTIITGLLLMAGILTVIASIFQLFSRLYSLTLERQGEWGLYLAIGAAPKTVAVMIVTEAVLLCAVGSLVGLVFGYILYLWSVNFITAHQAFPFIYPSISIVLLIAFAIFLVWELISAIAAVIPAYRSSHIEPSLVMTRGEFD
ncbi:MAG: FtsX-like permease family protein [Pelosinus sp.]|nr:FtsX-like permease family protein [Pelosinus sp.]